MKKPYLAVAAAAAIALTVTGCSGRSDAEIAQYARDANTMHLETLTDQEIAVAVRTGCDLVDDAPNLRRWAELVYAAHPFLLRPESAKNLAQLGMEIQCPDLLAQLGELDSSGI
ncbi:hypothetical protein [Agromyces humi]|uniref:hypothetical protein n=1 Tax=Agromyces humi TaxID=1766800 RepID=UPI00135A0358|nr:hypothetical protein [Agromyces humi]